MPLTLPRERYRNVEEGWRAFMLAITGLASGRSNATGAVTLRQNETTTTVTDANVTAASVIRFMPTTANAASLDSLGMYVSAVGEGSFTITHDSNAASDRTFRYAIQG